jgi:hypothetical protein
MSFYRIYPLSPTGGIGTPIDAECADDSSALVAASLLDDEVAYGCEVWETTRFLGRFHFRPVRMPAPTPETGRACRSEAAAAQ